jgi:hypothetical protein
VKSLILLTTLLCVPAGFLHALVGAGGQSSEGELLAHSGDAYVRHTGTTWMLGTAKVEKTLQLKDDHFFLVSFKDQQAHHEYIQGPSDPIRLELDGREVTGSSERWMLVDAHSETLQQGELSLRITLRNDAIELTEHFIVYPNESIIQESSTIKNISDRDVTIADPYFLQMSLLQKEHSAIDFSYMTGGICVWGSWILKTQPLTTDYHRHFDATDRPECLPGKPCTEKWQMGSSIYAPIQAFYDRQSKGGLFIGWDYLGRWASDVGNYRGAPVYVSLMVSGYKQQLSPGASINMPWAFTGVFDNDLDDMGNQLLDYQYRYKWDYTRDAYFPAIQMLGYWWNGASDYDPKHLRMDVEPISTYRKVFRMADLMRYVGADIFWRDYGWWDIAGDWNGPDFFETGRYLSKYNMKQTIYTIVYDAQQGSRVVHDHPDWLIVRDSGWGEGDFAAQYVLDQSKPGVIDWELALLQEQVRRWGAFEWRKDDSPLHHLNYDYTLMLSQDQNFRHLLKSFLDRNPQNAFHGCDGGGNDLSYEVLRMAVAWQLSDGCVGRYRNYYASYLFPPDKILNMPDDWDPDKFNKEEWRGLLWSSFPMTGDTLDPTKREQLRILIDIYHYLANKGVVGRWVKVYHPSINGDTPDWYLQRMSADNLRGVIMPAHDLKTPITIFPKGLLPDKEYDISFQESTQTQKRRGSDLMTNGIAFESVPDGELIYFGLPMHPRSPADKTPPSPPSNVMKTVGTNMNIIGVEITWSPAHDDNWISYYNVYRNGDLIDKVAKGTYYFDHSAGADLAAIYKVQAVDGSGNVSPEQEASGEKGTPAFVVDDTSDQVSYTGTGWAHEHRTWAHSGTESVSRQSGDSMEIKFEGNFVTLYGRLGDSMGRADVFIDQKLDHTIDTYDADEIPNMPIYTRTFSSIAKHTFKIVVRGDHQWRSSDAWVVIDALQIGRSPVHVVEDVPGFGVDYIGSGWQHSKKWLPPADAAGSQASGDSLSWTDHPGDIAQYSFEGTGITLIGKRCPSCGMADIYVDGGLETRVDTYAPEFNHFRINAQGLWQVPVFEKTWITSGKHTIKVVASQEKNMLSSDRLVYLDAFQVSGR